MAHVLTMQRKFEAVKIEDATELAKELGLDLQASRYSKNLAGEAFTPMTADELAIWGYYCPQVYRKGAPVDDKDPARALESYAFDNVPVEVMRHWKQIKDNYHFDRYEIWTTERARSTSLDPLLIGVLGNAFYLLARWGLESPEALPLNEVAKLSADRIWETEPHEAEYKGFFFLRRVENGRLLWPWRGQAVLDAAHRLIGWNPPLLQR